ncbi:hypothetical protein EG329_007395 [Mollisiaceae sp. DMI_Dod_QoI]|nr:hypothetical protein EG329_007395 [Helotiales sp. DMI_Dod_QoI]
MFSDLPAELQRLVWQHALPDPRQMPGSIIVVVDFDLSRPRAILPSIIEYKDAYHRANSRYNDAPDGDGDDAEGNDLWDFDSATMADCQRTVISLLHTCRTSRTTAMDVYRLGLASSVAQEQVPWWTPQDDMVLFAEPHTFKEERAMIYWLSQRREVDQSNLSSLQHIAFILSRNVSTAMDPVTYRGESVLFTEDGLLLNFPNLQSLSLFIDPVGSIPIGFRRNRGKIILWEPEDVIVGGEGHLKPSEISERIADNFEQLVRRRKGLNCPLVECFVVGVKTRKKFRSAGG